MGCAWQEARNVTIKGVAIGGRDPSFFMKK